MTSFSTAFLNNHDDSVFDILGDDIYIGGSLACKGELTHTYEDDELGNRIDIVEPYIEIQDKFLPLFTIGTILTIHTVNYKVLRYQPKDSRTTHIELTEMR